MLPLSKIPRFDPLTAPIVGVDHHLRALSENELSVDFIRARFGNPKALELTLTEIHEPRLNQQPLKPAAVLVGLVERAELTVILTQRSQHLSSHSGQIAFPGGKVDPADASAEATALREAHEEVGLNPELVTVLGQLNPMITGTAYRINPVVAEQAFGCGSISPCATDLELECGRTCLAGPAHALDPLVEPWLDRCHALERLGAVWHFGISTVQPPFHRDSRRT